MFWYTDLKQAFEPTSQDVSGTVSDIYESLGYESAEEAFDERYNVTQQGEY